MERKLRLLFAICLFIDPSRESQCAEAPISGLLQSLGYSPSCVSGALSLCGSNPNEQSALHTKLEEIRQDLQKYSTTIGEAIHCGAHRCRQDTPLPADCSDLLKQGLNSSGLFTVYPYKCCPNRPVTVFCDHATDGGGWTVIQRRVNLTVREDFARTWVEYALGFGNLEGEFWLGLDDIHALTSNRLMEMRVDLEDYDDAKRFANYGRFYVGSADTNYKLSVGRYSGDAGDGFLNRHDGHPFSTIDRDNDSYKDHCAKMYPGGWWYDACHISNINGKPLVGAHKSYADGINWRPWREYHYSMKRTSMMVRPAFPRAQETSYAEVEGV